MTTFGSFGTQAAQAKPFSFGGTTGTGFGASTSTGFGSVPSTGFGTPTTSAGFGGFGTTGQTTGFGMPQTGGFGTSTGFASTGFGTPAPSTGFGGSTFGGFGATTTQSTGFGTGTSTFQWPASTTSAGFGLGTGGFGTTTTQSTGFGGFGSTPFGMSTQNPGGGLFGAQPPAPAPYSSDSFLGALFCPQVFNDERDAIISKWNQIQACWGFGKGYYSGNAPPVQFTPDNPFCKFKAIGYSCLPSAKKEDGLVILIVKKKIQKGSEHEVVDGLARLFGNKPNLSINVDALKQMAEEKTEMVIYLLERAQDGTSRRVPSEELVNYFQQAHVKTQMEALGISDVAARFRPTQEQLGEYLKESPKGIDPLLWEQAKLENPNPEKYIPVPILGFKELQQRLQCQKQETQIHQAHLDVIASDIATLQKKCVMMQSRVAEVKRSHLKYAHRVLKVFGDQEVLRKRGMPLQPHEEQLKIQLEGMLARMRDPSGCCSRLTELLAQVRLQGQPVARRPDTEGREQVKWDPAAIINIQQVLNQGQEGMAHLLSIIKSDLTKLETIQKGAEAVKS